MISESNNQQQGGFVVHVYSPGNQIIQTQTNNYYGPVYNGAKGSAEQNGYSDGQIAAALEAVNGSGKVMDAKWKWAGAYWYLRWACNFPVAAKDFCDRIAQLPFQAPLECPCDLRNIREFVRLSFMEQDPRQMEKVKPSTDDRRVFAVCREVALKVAEELGKVCLTST